MKRPDMSKLTPLAVGTVAGSVAGALMVRERRARLNAERLGAATLETLLNAIDANDAGTGAHVRRVADYSLILADAADVDEHVCHSIERVALFHDIGKIHEAISDIFHDDNRLTALERRAVMTHPQRGADVLAPLKYFYPDLSEGVLSHHERWDGTGYPRHLKGRRIPLSARVVAIADTFDAITHARRYSRARSVEEAKKAIAEGRGTQFDPEMADLFLSPPVMELVERRMGAKHAPRRKNQRRNGTKTDDPVPDLKFRWRSEVVAPPPRDR
jgi:HD-GYP domain-containing protein (c-di-GMP phosphodiesterase class II)